jgi:hypothetical protein
MKGEVMEAATKTINGQPMAVGDTVSRATDRDRYGTVVRHETAADGSDWVIVDWVDGPREWCQPFALDYDRRVEVGAPCPKCDGEGVVEATGISHRAWVDCRKCGGTGEGAK